MFLEVGRACILQVRIRALEGITRQIGLPVPEGAPLSRQPLQGGETGAEGGFEFGQIGIVVWDVRAEAAVKFTDAGDSCEGGDVAGMKAAAGKDCDPTARLCDESGQNPGRIGSGRFSARGQDAIGSGFHHVFQGFQSIVGLVESAMKGDGKRSGEGDEFAGTGDVDGAIRKQNAGDDALDVFGAERTDFGLHLRAFRIGVGEIPGAGTHEDVHGKLDGGTHVAD